MINLGIEIKLPQPWHGESFKLDQAGPVNFLVGSNGSGKSRFARAIVPSLPSSRFLGTDRLSGMEQERPLAPIIGDSFSNWIA